MILHHRYLRIGLLALLPVGCMIASSIFVARQTVRHNLQQQALQGSDKLQLRALALQRLIERFKILPTILAVDPDLRAALITPPTPESVLRLNRKLEKATALTHAATLTILDYDGLALAASNWNMQSSNVGVNYGFRPYFLQAMQNGTSAFYAVGVTTRLPGYFIGEAIRDGDGDGRILGVISVKIDLATLDREWLDGVEPIMLSDANGIVFLANRAEWEYRQLHALDATILDSLQDTRQYDGHPLHTSTVQSLETLSSATRRVQIKNPLMDGEYLWQTRDVGELHWQMHLLQNTRTSVIAGSIAGALTALIWVPLILLGMFLHQRARMLRYRQRSRAELERMVSHYTAALRSAQDELVDAANKAKLDQNTSLEHLPQGVSVVDARLRLIAWNTRYVEIFRYPADLMQVGRPIVDLFRYNARRGLLGPGDVEDAIQRRLDFLRDGGPYIHERERPDGTVLEMRGNPLPDGGFVTSYADITTYKTAARDLRTLATTLEHRIDERTRDLEAAKAEAEHANRSKTRFITAAVHDLLQPLNAARMFVSILRGRLIEPEQHELAERVDSALDAQDELLSSLLDIAQLEAGVLPVHVRDVPLAPLLTVLAHQFGILAQARGLTLHWVPSSAVLRTDPLLLRRILQNFLSNAIHYTPRGRVLLGCRHRGGTLRIEVWDTGVGIPETKQQKIFEEFSRLDHGRRADDRGAGLGLSIVERIAHLLGHRIALRSWPGRGSVFSVDVPLGNHRIATARVDEKSSPTLADDSPLHGAHIWCIDDDALVRDATRRLLHHWGCRVTLASDPAEALRLATPAEAPDLLLLDYQLGDSLGPDLLAALHQGWQSEPPVIVISGQQDPHVRDRLHSLGLRFLAKPVAPATLRALMTQTLLGAMAS